MNKDTRLRELRRDPFPVTVLGVPMQLRVTAGHRGSVNVLLEPPGGSTNRRERVRISGGCNPLETVEALLERVNEVNGEVGKPRIEASH